MFYNVHLGKAPGFLKHPFFIEQLIAKIFSQDLDDGNLLLLQVYLLLCGLFIFYLPLPLVFLSSYCKRHLPHHYKSRGKRSRSATIFWTCIKISFLYAYTRSAILLWDMHKIIAGKTPNFWQDNVFPLEKKISKLCTVC